MYSIFHFNHACKKLPFLPTLLCFQDVHGYAIYRFKRGEMVLTLVSTSWVVSSIPVPNILHDTQLAQR